MQVGMHLPVIVRINTILVFHFKDYLAALIVIKDSSPYAMLALV